MGDSRCTNIAGKRVEENTTPSNKFILIKNIFYNFVTFRADVLRVCAVEKEYLWDVIDFVTISTILSSANAAGDFITLPSEIPFATAESVNILFLLETVIALHSSPKVISVTRQ